MRPTVLSWFLVAVLMTLSPASVVAQPVLPGAAGQELEVRFVRALTPEEVIAVVHDLGLQPLELYVRNDRMTAGYALGEGQSIETAIEQMKQKQREFLEGAMASVSEFRFVKRSLTERREDLRLGREFRAALRELEAGSFGIAGLRIAGGGVANALLEKGVAGSIAVSRAGDRRRQVREGGEVTGQAREVWAPNRGTSRVSRSAIFQTFSFNSLKGFTSTTSYEHLAEIWDSRFANYGYYWASNMPEAFLDLLFFPSVGVDMFAVGSTAPASFQRNFEYYSHIALVSGGSSTVPPVVRTKGQLGRTTLGCHSLASCILNPLAATPPLVVFQAPNSNPAIWAY